MTISVFYHSIIIIGRLIFGIGIGLVSIAMPLFVSKYSPQEIRDPQNTDCLGWHNGTIVIQICFRIFIARNLGSSKHSDCLGWHAGTIIIHLG